ncbi:hypothetical protein ACFCX4_00525 [Kitasatospora sp. NPDC056327]|uniref:hypothetical protein n=1 Tax=Kitasatospora sp. NPDC056327 TaxID=3345785 RepID=UPI0035D849CC
MKDHRPNPSLAALLSEARWSTGELLRAVTELARAQGLELSYHRTAPAHWLTGTRPREPAPKLIAEAFSRRLRRPVSTADTGFGQPEAAQDGEPSATGPGDPPRVMELARTDLHPEDGPRARERIYDSARLPARSTGRPDDRPPLASHGAAGDLVALFRELHVRYGGTNIRPMLAAYLAHADRTNGSAVREQQADQARLTYRMGAMTVDAGHHHLAQQYLLCALDLAARCGDRATYALALRLLSFQALSLGYTARAFQLAEQATAVRMPDSPLRALLLGQRALCRAATAERSEAVADLLAAERCYGIPPDGDDPFLECPRAEFDYWRGVVLSACRAARPATRAFEESLRRWADNDHMGLAMTYAAVARSAVSLGDPDQAALHCKAFLTHYGSTASAYADRELTRVRSVLRTLRRNRAAAEVLDRADTLFPAVGPPPRAAVGQGP